MFQHIHKWRIDAANAERWKWAQAEKHKIFVTIL